VTWLLLRLHLGAELRRVTVPADRVADLRGHPGVTAVWAVGPIRWHR